MKIKDWVILATIVLVFFSLKVSQKTSIDEVTKHIKYQDSLFTDLYYSIVDTFEKDAFLVTLTTYNATKEQCDSDPTTTASALKVHKSSKYVALSRDLLSEFPYGSLVTLQNAGEYNGVYVVADCMNSRFIRHIDILIKTKKHTKIKNVIIKPYKDG